MFNKIIRMKLWAVLILVVFLLLIVPGIGPEANYDTLVNTKDNKDIDESNATVSTHLGNRIAESISHVEDVITVLFGRFYPTRDELFLGTPTIGNLITGRLRVLTNPSYFKNYFYEALVKGVFIIPMPIDLIKPEALLPTAEVRAGDNPLPLPEQFIDLSNVTYEWSGRVKTVRDFVITTETDCLVIIYNGQLVYEDYANGWSPEMRHQPWSVTKAITSAMVGIAWGEGKIDSVHDPIEKYIEELRGTVWEGSTIENLLQMESGIFWDEEVPLLAFNTQVQQWMSMFLDFFTGGLLGTTRNEFFKTLDRVAEPGEEFRYNSNDTQVLAWLVETVYNTSFADAVSEKLWKPAGMEGDAMILTDRVGNAIASQGFYSRVYDLARFGELYRNEGKTPDGRQIVPAEWVEMSVNFSENSNGSYGYQWWNGSGSTTINIYEASGFQGNKISVSPDASMTGVRLSHHLGANFRPNGDNPAKLSTYGFEIEMGSKEWHTMLTAVAEALDPCDSPDAPSTVE